MFSIVGSSKIVLPPSLREVARKAGRRECRIDVRTLPQSALRASSPLREGAKSSILLLTKTIIYPTDDV